MFNALPRLGRSGISAKYGKHFEGKLIMRTDAVDMYNIHYITQLADGFRKVNLMRTSPHEMNTCTLLHFKENSILNGSIFGRVLPINATWEQEQTCMYSAPFQLQTTDDEWKQIRNQLQLSKSLNANNSDNDAVLSSSYRNLSYCKDWTPGRDGRCDLLHQKLPVSFLDKLLQNFLKRTRKSRRS